MSEAGTTTLTSPNFWYMLISTPLGSFNIRPESGANA